MELTLGVVGSRTYPLTAEQYKALGDGSKTPTPAQRQALAKGKALVEARVRQELTVGVKYAKVISGGAHGPDSWGVDVAKQCGFTQDQVDEILPDWDRYGKSAGFKRNTTIAERSRKILAFWDGVSRGTLDTITKANVIGTVVVVVFPSGREKTNGIGW